ncbi:MAG: thioredoxin domain-containing protein, partial [Proteobacteria bacterium]|nr:thioredoxin domain-containing protein [Pseudomonadota bacterium]
MEKETFKDSIVSDYMNKHFINIKVDREENPEIDNIYMTATQMMTGSGGWPLNVVCLPNGKPIYGGTYHTKEQWVDILNKIQNVYENDKTKLVKLADQIMSGIQEINHFEYDEDPPVITSETLHNEMKIWSGRWDSIHGGEKTAQKFISPVKFNYIQQYQYLNNDNKIKNYFEKSLQNIANSGIVDHLEGGFYRYTVEDEWKIPHFEKMLYDQAQMISLYSKAYKIFKKESYKDVVYKTISFLKSKLSTKNGLFFAAMDADTDGEEGKYYSFQKEELEKISGSTDFELFTSYYNIELSNPWEDDKYLLLPNEYSLEDDWINLNNISKNELDDFKSEWIKNILEIKSKRTKPRIDDKIIISWNSLAIIGLIDAYEAFKDDDFLNIAVNMFDELEKNSFRKNKLIHTYKENQYQEGVLEDYAYFSKASMKLFQATGLESYFNFSKKITDQALEIYKDNNSDLLFYSDNEELFSKVISIDDGVIPSPNSIIAEQLYNIGHVIFDDYYLDLSDKMVSSVKDIIDGNINSYSVWANNILNRVESFYEIA